MKDETEEDITIPVEQANMMQIVAFKKEEIDYVILICNKLEEEKLNSLLELKQTQVTSTEQLEKLFTLETKQDFLENTDLKLSVEDSKAKARSERGNHC